jgi:phosphomannomutase
MRSLPIQLPSDLMVSVSGFRGRVGDPLTPELVTGVAAAFGAFLRADGRGETICVGRDSRTSGPMLTRAAVAGLQSVGIRVVDVGVVPTPTLLLATRHHGAAGGICVTASHNPAEWNALKLVTGEGIFLDAELSGRFQEYLRTQDPPRAAWNALGEVSEDANAWPRHLEALLALPELDVAGLRERAFHVALDCVHGAGGLVMPEQLQRLGCRVSAIGTTADGRFPRDPEPTAANLKALGDLVKETGAEIGLAVDPDVDRLSLVDERGRPVGEDLTLALAAAVVLRRTPGPVVTNLSTSRVIEDVAAAYKSSLIRAPVGEVNVARRMQSEGAVVGGEGNGGVIHPRLQHTRDAPAAAALILQHLLDEKATLSEAIGRWPTYVIVKEKVSFPRESLADAYRALEDGLAAEERDTSDGLRLAWPKKRAWLHVRPSGTEPVVRLIAEAPDAAAAKALVRAAAERLQGLA